MSFSCLYGKLWRLFNYILFNFTTILKKFIDIFDIMFLRDILFQQIYIS